MNVRDGHTNGTRYIIESVTKHLIKARKLDRGKHEELLIPKIPTISTDTDFPVNFKRTQFPILGAYYLTFNRAQGQTLERCGLDLSTSVFTHGQLYVGYSCDGDPDTFFAYADQREFAHLKDKLDTTKTYTRNVVYPEVLRN